MLCGTCKKRLESAVVAVQHVASCIDARWKDVAEARAAGDQDRAAKIARTALGIKGPEMDDETKAKLREYAREHAEEIKGKRAQKALVRRRIREMSKPVTKRSR